MQDERYFINHRYQLSFRGKIIYYSVQIFADKVLKKSLTSILVVS